MLYILFSMVVIGEAISQPVVHEFAGYSWIVKTAEAGTMPGPNYFSDSTESVWVDDDGLHLTLRHDENRWLASEVICRERFGYGRYVFALEGRIDQLPAPAVFGIFTWDTNPEAHHREIDIEFSQWGTEYLPNGQYVVQPHTIEGNRHRFEFSLSGTYSTHVITWLPERVEFASYHGHGYPDFTEEDLISTWVYEGNVPRPGRERVRLNFWLYQGQEPEGEGIYEVTLRDFRYIQ